MTTRRKLAFLTATLVIATLGAEVLLRIVDVATGTIVAPELLSQLDRGARIGHPFLGYTARRSFDGFELSLEPGRRFRVRTNADGFRTHELVPKAPGEFRIVIFGDSFTYGVNADQDETYPARLERLLRSTISERIRVFSLGVSSYSAVRYAMLARLYMERLRPDMVVAAVDASDFQEDADRIGSYVVDADNAPIVLKNAADISADDPIVVTIDAKGVLAAVLAKTEADLLPRLEFASSLAHHLHSGWGFLRARIAALQAAWINRSDRRGSLMVVSWDDLVRQSGSEDVSKVLPEQLRVDFVPYPLATARNAFSATFDSLRYIKRQADAHGAAFYLSSYPYPWMVSVEEAVPYQYLSFGRVYDLRRNRVQPELLADFAARLGVPHLDAFPLFERNPHGMYGQYDPHFNADGYAQYARFLFAALGEDVRRRIGASP